ncbi:MAG: hypothetical protein KGP35_09930 [Bacteroidetes bacterium]|nr:hypothetical protein [Bacteroidota bacterium]
MANTVTVNIPDMKIGKPDIFIQAKNDDGIIGTLTISKSFIEWKSKNKKTGKRKMSWKQFDNLIATYFNDK